MQDMFAYSNQVHKKMANYLLFNLIHKIKKSHKYRKFLGVSYLEGDRLILLNPWRNGNSIISACGPSLKSNYDDDRMNIIRIHLSDPTSMEVNAQDSYFAELVSRLSNTNGQLKIEGIPSETRTGWFWKICRTLFQEYHKCGEEDEQLSDYEFPPEIVEFFQVYIVTIDDAVKYGKISNDTRSLLKAYFASYRI